ncbi:hypothetical protein HY251_10045 [bacterium]|nr:hypothetical protein [bacterium]
METSDRLWLAREVVRHLVKAIKMRRLYGAKHAHARAALDELAGRLGTFHILHDELWLEVANAGFRVGDEDAGEDARELRLAFALYVGGARRLALRPGIAHGELDAFVAILAAPNDGSADPTTLLLESDLEHVDLVCLDELTEGWDIPENLSELSQKRIDELNREADALIEDLKQRRLFGAGDRKYETTDTGEELSQLEEIGLAGVHDPDPEDSDESFTLLGGGEGTALVEEARCLGPDETIKSLVGVVLDGLVLAPDEISLTEAQWFLAEVPLEALRREDLGLLAWVLERYRAELDARSSPELEAAQERIADALEWAIARVQSDEGVEQLVKVACGEPLGGPAALCRVARVLGPAGNAVVCRVYARTDEKSLREALNAYLAEQGEIDPGELARLCAPTVPAETARWALFTAGKHLRGEQVEVLYETARRHPDPAVGEYASFLWRSQSPQGRLQTFLETLALPDAAERIRALAALVQARDAVALDALKKLVDDPAFLQRTKEEKAAFLSAIAAIGGAAMRGFLMRQQERPTGIFQRKAVLEIREGAQRAIEGLTERLPTTSPLRSSPGGITPRPGTGALRIRGSEPPSQGGRAP